MITDDVIKEVYRRFDSPSESSSNLNIDYFMEILSPKYNIEIDGDKLIVNDLGENAFKVVLLKAINTIIEFDRFVAIVLRNHIIFFDHSRFINIYYCGGNKKDRNIEPAWRFGKSAVVGIKYYGNEQKTK